MSCYPYKLRADISRALILLNLNSNLMKKLFLTLGAVFTVSLQLCYGQKKIVDESIRYQQERMVFKQWDRGKFEPGSGWLGINPYYWLTWGLHPNYPDLDRRPLSATGPQTQRLALVGTMNGVSGQYKLESDTLRNSALLEVANFSGGVSAADPLWLLYYSKELKPVLEHSASSILSPLAPAVQRKVVSEGLFDWYSNELAILKERVEGARSANMDRGSRILAYHRMLMEYRALSGSWAIRTATASATMGLTSKQEQVKSGQVNIGSWTSGSDVEIAKKVLAERKY